MTTGEVLKAARALVTEGWTQFSSRAVIDGQDCYCVMGALNSAARTLGAMDAVHLAIQRALGIIGTGAVTTWNDAPGRTQAEVLAAFDKAIAEVGQ